MTKKNGQKCDILFRQKTRFFTGVFKIRLKMKVPSKKGVQKRGHFFKVFPPPCQNGQNGHTGHFDFSNLPQMVPRMGLK